MVEINKLDDKNYRQKICNFLSNSEKLDKPKYVICYIFNYYMNIEFKDNITKKFLFYLDDYDKCVNEYLYQIMRTDVKN